jgi:hypothetical protein
MRRSLTTLFLLVLAACGSDGGSDDVMNTSGTIQLTGNTTYEVTEGAVANIMVHRIGDVSGMARVDYATLDGTAVAGMDYRGTSGTLVFADGVSGYQTISIPITDDNTPEVAETFTVTLSNVSGATLGAPSSATVNIVNAATTLPITDGNAQHITSTVLEAVTSTVDFIDILDIVGLPVTASATPAPAQSAVVMGVSTDVIACDDGEVSVTWDDADNNLVISTGDTFDIDFTDCWFADMETQFDGLVSLTDLVVTGDPFNQIAPWGLALTIGFDTLQVIDNARLAGLGGGLDLDLSSEDNVVVNLSITTASLSAILPRGIVQPVPEPDTETLSDYVLDETLDLNALTQVASTSGTFASTLLEGTVTFETLQDFVITLDDNPSAGQLFISDSSSSVLVTVLDNINVQLEIDIDLDGMIDRTIVVTWAELDID